MIVQFDATIEDFVDVTIRSLKRSETLRTWHWQGVASMALIGAVSAIALTSGSIAIRSAIAAAAGLAAVALYLWTSPETFKERLGKLCREQLGTDGPVRILAELGDSGVAMSQAGTKTIYDWAIIEGIEETDDAVYFYRSDKGCFAVRKRGFDSEESKNKFVELARDKINSA
jgi:hypothetical protein